MLAIASRITTLCALGALVLAGCGGSSSKPKAAKSSIAAPAKVARRASLLGGATSAGQVASYVPRGKIVADSGFRPAVNGFAFENYGNDAGPINLTPLNVEHLFGPQVCASGSGASCVLIPPAKYWMDHVNATMAGGHCMGFSVSALRFFTHDLSPSTFGGARTIDLPVQGNRSLQSLIAEDFAYQDLPAVTDRAIEGTPTQVLAALIRALAAHQETYTLGIVKADGSGGHAITPFAVEDRGSGQAAILVYDNNFPGVVRAVEVDTTRDTWRYVGGINPSDTNEVYEGDAQSKSMVLLPTSPGERVQPCPFCNKPHTGAATHSPIDKLHYIEVALSAPQSKGGHPHLVFVDSQGRRTGYVKDRLLQQIPGIRVVQNYSVQNWNDAPEPTFHLRVNHPSYKVLVDGSDLTQQVKAQLQVNGAGLVFFVRDIRMAPRQTDQLLISKGNLAMSYLTGSKFPGSPTLGVSFPQFDLKNSTAGKIRARLVTMAAGWIAYAPGSPLTIAVRPNTGTAVLVSDGDRPLVPSQARYVLYVQSSPLNGGLPERTYMTDQLRLDASKGEIARWHYLRPTTAKLPVDVLDANGHRVRQELVPTR